jgi:hypothetical protein
LALFSGFDKYLATLRFDAARCFGQSLYLSLAANMILHCQLDFLSRIVHRFIATGASSS